MKNFKNFSEYAKDLQERVVNLYNDFRPKTKGFITFDEVDKVVSVLFVNGGEKDINEIQEARNASVTYFDEKFDHNDKDFYTILDVMSAITGVCDHLKFKVGRADLI